MTIGIKDIAEGHVLDILIDRYEKYFTSIKNIKLYNTTKFFARVQRINEDFESYLSEIIELSKWCDFGQAKEKIIRDRLISGINDFHLQHKFVTQAEDTSLEEVIEKCREYEQLKEKLNSIMGENNLIFSKTKEKPNNNDLNDTLNHTPSDNILSSLHSNLKEEANSDIPEVIEILSESDNSESTDGTMEEINGGDKNKNERKSCGSISECHSSVVTMEMKKCDVCNESFIHLASLKQHQKTHKKRISKVNLRKLKKLKSFVLGNETICSTFSCDLLFHRN